MLRPLRSACGLAFGTLLLVASLGACPVGAGGLVSLIFGWRPWWSLCYLTLVFPLRRPGSRIGVVGSGTW